MVGRIYFNTRARSSQKSPSNHIHDAFAHRLFTTISQVRFIPFEKSASKFETPLRYVGNMYRRLSSIQAYFSFS